MKKYGIMIGHLLLYVGLYFGVLQGMLYLYKNILIPITPWFKENLLTFIVINDIIALGLFYLLFRYVLKRDFVEATRFYKMDKTPVLLSIGLGLLAGIFTAMFSQLPAMKSEQMQFYALFKGINDTKWYVFLGFLLIGNLFKEVLFRALIFNELRKALPLVVAVILQGVFYGGLFFNFDPPLSLLGFFGAVLFAVLYVLFNSIWAPILAQIFCQGIQYILWNIPFKFQSEVVLYSVMGISLILIGIGIYYASKQRSEDSLEVKATERGVQA